MIVGRRGPLSTANVTAGVQPPVSRGERAAGAHDVVCRLLIAEVEHEQRFRGWRGGAVAAARSYLEVNSSAWHLDEYAVITIMIPNARICAGPR
jgi:hypothetical protein